MVVAGALEVGWQSFSLHPNPAGEIVFVAPPH